MRGAERLCLKGGLTLSSWVVIVAVACSVTNLVCSTVRVTTMFSVTVCTMELTLVAMADEVLVAVIDFLTVGVFLVIVVVL